MQVFNGADMTFVIISAALVMLMIPGLALFYGGMVKSTNVLSTTLHSYAALKRQYLCNGFFIGYSLTFGPDIGGFIGNLDYAFLHSIVCYQVLLMHQQFLIFCFITFSNDVCSYHGSRYIRSFCRERE